MSLIKRYRWSIIIFICAVTIISFIPKALCHDRPHNSDDIEWFEKLVKYHDFTSGSYYCEVEYDIDKKVNFFRKYQNVSNWTKYKLYELLMFRGNPNDNDEIFNLTVELAKNGNFKAQKDLIDAYEKGWFMEKNATRIEYLTKISECFKESNETQNCQR